MFLWFCGFLSYFYSFSSVTVRQLHYICITNAIQLFRYVYHTISLRPCSFRNSLAFLKWPFPKKPLCAESGDGCGDSSTRCLVLSIMPLLLRASRPQSMKTRWSHFSFKCLTVASVNCSQPLPRWLPARCASTVKTLLSNSTPCCCQLLRLPRGLACEPYSSSISL